MNKHELIEQKEQIDRQLLEIEHAEKAATTEVPVLLKTNCNGIQVLYPPGKRITKGRESKLLKIAKLVEDFTYQKPKVIFINPSNRDTDLVWNFVIQLNQ